MGELFTNLTLGVSYEEGGFTIVSPTRRELVEKTLRLHRVVRVAREGADALELLPDPAKLNPLTTERSLRLPTLTAENLLAFFEKLQVAHSFECHDLVRAIVTGLHAGSSQQSKQTGWRIPDEGEPIEEGGIYGIAAQSETGRVVTHTAIGTATGGLLGLIGKGLPPAILDPGDALDFYGRNAESAIIRIR